MIILVIFHFFLKQPVFFHKRNTILFNLVPAWTKLVKTHHHVKWFDYHLVCETLCSHYKSSKVTIFNSRIRSKCFSTMEAGFVYDCSSGKYPIFIFFIRKYLTSDYLIFFKNHGNCIGILLKSRIFYYFNIVFLQNLSHSLRVLLKRLLWAGAYHKRLSHQFPSFKLCWCSHTT